MKKIYTLLFFLTIASCGIYAQSLQLQTVSGQIIPNGGTIGVKGTLYDTTVDVSVEIKIKNISSSSVTLKALKVVKTLPGVQSAYFCFAGNCFPPDINLSPNDLTLGAGMTDANFSAHINPTASAGSALVYYKVFNTANPNDTVSVFVQYEIWHLGINDLSNATAEMGAAFPNPANEKFTVNCTLTGFETARLVLQNVLGSEVREQTISGGSGKIIMNVGDLPEGVYFYSLFVNGKSISTRKLLIRH